MQSPMTQDKIKFLEWLKKTRENEDRRKRIANNVAKKFFTRETWQEAKDCEIVVNGLNDTINKLEKELDLS
jgi:hypothetical protein